MEGSYPGMLKTRSYELRLPADWPPATVIVNGKAVPQGSVGKPGWRFEGNTLTTIIPVPSGSVASRVVIEVRRAAGFSARRGEIDGFAGAMTRLRGAYDAMQQTSPIAAPPDPLIDAMQTGDRLSYHPDHAVDEIAHFHEVLPKAQAALNDGEVGFVKRLNDPSFRVGGSSTAPADIPAEKQRRLDLLHRAEALVAGAGK